MKKIMDWFEIHTQWKSLIGIFVVVAIFLAFGFRADHPGVRIAVEGDDFVIRYTDQYETRFSKHNVQSVQLVKEPDHGMAVHAVTDEKYLVGVWEKYGVWPV